MVTSMGSGHSERSFPGLYDARVEAIEGDDLDLGCIRVSIQSIYGEEALENLQIARPCFPYGHFFLPERNDHVWVAFENGNPEDPVWLGIWYPKGTILKEANITKPERRVIQTQLGSSIIFNDDKGTGNLEPQDDKALMNVLEFGNAHITLKSKGVIEIDAPTVIINGRLVDPATPRTI